MKKEILFGLLIALVIAVFISPFASKSPDGLDKTAEDLKFVDKAEGKTVISAPIPDYAVPGISNEVVAGSSAGLIGTLVVFGVAYGAGKVFQKKNNQSKSL